jgi:hypothetical protein
MTSEEYGDLESIKFDCYVCHAEVVSATAPKHTQVDCLGLRWYCPAECQIAKHGYKTEAELTAHLQDGSCPRVVYTCACSGRFYPKFIIKNDDKEAVCMHNALPKIEQLELRIEEGR